MLECVFICLFFSVIAFLLALCLCHASCLQYRKAIYLPWESTLETARFLHQTHTHTNNPKYCSIHGHKSHMKTDPVYCAYNHISPKLTGSFLSWQKQHLASTQFDWDISSTLRLVSMPLITGWWERLNTSLGALGVPLVPYSISPLSDFIESPSLASKFFPR